MPLNPKASELFKGFSKLDRQTRYQRLLAMGALTKEDIQFLQDSDAVHPDLAEKLVENVIGYFHLPLGVATNFKIDGIDRVIPMAVEETSIIAALSKTAKWIREHGEITTSVLGEVIIGQIQFADVIDIKSLGDIIARNKFFLIEFANENAAASLVKRGGGVRDLELRQLPRPDGGTMAILHVLADCCDAMGANIMNQILESLKTPLENLTGEQVSMCILSNLNDRKITRAEVVLSNIDPELGHRLHEASIFAECDPYRAATSNKGVMNGMDALLIATGNDWRAVEAGVHAYASRDGQYRSITQWRWQDQKLIGKLEAPIIVGTVGGVTKVHPTAQLALRILDIQKSNDLARLVAAVGLVQNLGAIRALCTEGIIMGHMKLHIDNLILNVGAEAAEVPSLKRRLEEFLAYHKRITLTNAKEILQELRLKMNPGQA